jgi:hypothetical protein
MFVHLNLKGRLKTVSAVTSVAVAIVVAVLAKLLLQDFLNMTPKKEGRLSPMDPNSYARPGKHNPPTFI